MYLCKVDVFKWISVWLIIRIFCKLLVQVVINLKKSLFSYVDVDTRAHIDEQAWPPSKEFSYCVNDTNKR
jgi:hypothetical protein